MFDISEVKRKQGKRKKQSTIRDNVFSHFDRPLPYYGTVPEQKWSDEKFLQLNRNEKGDFCLLVDFIWQGCGSIRKSDIPQIACQISMSENELDVLLLRLVRAGLLHEEDSRYIQWELRNQYNQVCSKNENMKRSPSADRDDEGVEVPF